MTTFTNVFGNETVPPSDYRYAAYTLSTSDTLVWPENYSGETGLLSASILDLTASGPGFTLTLPPADEVSTGRDILLRNVGGNSIQILQDGGASLVVLGTSESKYLYITDNSTAAGTWQAFTFGTGTSAADAALLAGSGLQANAGVLRIAAAYKSLNANYTLLTSDRAKLLDVITGSTTINLLQSSTVGDGYIVYIRNSSAGSVVLDAFGTETIDGSLTLTLFPDESLALLNNGSAWKSVGYGRDATFVFSEIVVDASLPSTVLSSADVAGRMIRVAGVATGNITVELPAIDNIYFVNTESGVGAFNVTFTTGAGTDVVLGADQKTVLYSDGTNVTTAITTSLTSTVQFADGSAAVPSINFALDLDTGFFRPGSGSVAFTSDGVQTVTLTDKGIFNVDGTAAEPSYSLTSDSTTGIYSAGPGALGITIAGVAEAVFSSAGLELADPLAVTEGGTGADTAAGARTNLGLGTISTVDSPVPVANGGTAASTAADARTNLGLVAGGAGDIWVEKAGDTMTAPLLFNIASSSANTSAVLIEGSIGAVNQGHALNFRQAGSAQVTGYVGSNFNSAGTGLELHLGSTATAGVAATAVAILEGNGKSRFGNRPTSGTTIGSFDINMRIFSQGLGVSGAGAEILFSNGVTGASATVSAPMTGSDGTNSQGYLVIATRETVAQALTERARFDARGVVAVNTAKAWVRFNGVGAVAINEAYNVGSVSDNGTGDYSINYSTPIPIAGAAAITPGHTGNTSLVLRQILIQNTVSLRFRVGTAASDADLDSIQVIVFN